MTRVAVTRTAHRLLPDARRVIAKPFLPSEQSKSHWERAEQLILRVLAIPDAEVPVLLAEILRDFAPRHDEFDAVLLRHFELVSLLVPPGALTRERKMLLGAYFTHEYSVEAAALFNPSMVLAPDQGGAPAGATRFVMSLRAVGEGHISSIELRTGVIDAHGTIAFDEVPAHLVTGRRTAPRAYEKGLFASKLDELGVLNEMSRAVLDHLPERFTLPGLESSLAKLEEEGPPASVRHETMRSMRVLAASNYVTSFDPRSALGSRVIFPASPHETNGMEDARFVRFTDETGAVRYYATYTAYDGFNILPQLIETEDFVSFTMSTLNGGAAQNKGMALFPRKIGGRFVTLSRQDRENLYLATSDNVRFWSEGTELRRPQYAWELLNIGNCGSPIETDAGWLVITHGVGAMRRYAISAILLDLEDPSRVIGELREPLLCPNDTERDGYVPNVVYACGAMKHGDLLVMPYGFSDYGTAIATVNLPELLAALTQTH